MRADVPSAKRLVIKVGASVLSRNGGILSRTALRTLVNAIAPLHRRSKEIVLVSSGAIACGMEVLRLAKRPSHIHELQAAAAIGQGKLMHLYETSARRHGIHTAQILLTREGMEPGSRRYRNAQRTLRQLLAKRVMPIVNENDTISTEEISFGDNDGLSAFVATMLGAECLVILTDVDGFYITHHGKRIRLEEVRGVGKALYMHCRSFDGQKTVGGMASKLNAARRAARHGIPMVLADGTSARALRRLFAGEAVGTRFLPARKAKRP
ncbi:MAG: glutamate 5-kinase [Deltaproteobacteria bacterium]|nr:glutamate 5-kinase [Deltaproteobacteria bacterium]